MAKTSRNKRNIKSILGYTIGSAALCATAFIVIPEVLPYISGTINKIMAKHSNAKKSEDDWGPVIERKHPEKIDGEKE